MKDILRENLWNNIEIATYGKDSSPINVSIENIDSNTILVDAEIYTIEGKSDNYLFNKLLEHAGHSVVIDFKDSKFILLDKATKEIILTADDVLAPRSDMMGGLKDE